MSTVETTVAESDPVISDTDIAIIGMAGHFPGATNVDELWSRVVSGDDCLEDLTVDQLVANGVARSDATAASYVRRTGILDGVEDFDPGFFGIGPRDAAIMDPQHRHFLECAWEALEAGGVVPERFDGAIGVFAGCGMNTYLLNNLVPNHDLVRQLGWFLLRHTGNDKDFLATTLSYRLDLRGPSVNVQTACSTSLVAVHLAVQSLLSMECDIALAGGATIEVPHRVGYEYQEGEILSPDGRCRAFDLESNGTVLTSGAGVVALRRLTDAWDDGDPILAVIKGSAVNNDGARKVSYLAPSVDGHADVVKEALTVAGVVARDVQLLEAHGTGTPVGDPIEVAALTEAFRATTDERGFCRLTSTKPNIGHLDTAAGVASLIKVVQALRHQTLPPIANHTGASSLLDLDNTPFTLSGIAAPWPDTVIRRAGVSSLGVGGTNAHVIVEEAPRRGRITTSDAEHVLALSGRDATSVADAARRLATHLEAHPDLDLADVAHTLATRRRSFPVRRVVTATDTESAITQLTSFDRARSFEHDAQDSVPRVAFLFPGGGSQYPAMARGLDHRFSTFHDVMSDGISRVRDLSGVDLGELLGGDRSASELNAPTVSLPAVFLTSLGLARQWLEWGVQPHAYIGHSLGEYVAAHLSGVLTLEDAVRLVVTRAALMEKVGGEQAAMLVVPLGESAARDLLVDGVSLAVVNTDDECVIAGRSDVIADIARRLESTDSPGTLIPLAAAAHSVLLEPVLDDFRTVVNSTTLSPPTSRYMSNFTGTWIALDQATDPEYWVQHLRHTVRYADNLRVALSEAPTVTVELGPGHSLSSYARRCAHPPVAAIPALRHARQDIDDTAFTVQAFAQQWATGVPVELDRLVGEGRHVLTLPTYPFQRSRHWIDPPRRDAARPRAAASDRAGHDLATTSGAAVELHRFEKPAEMWWEPVWDERPIEPSIGPWRRWHIVSAQDDLLAGMISDELTSRGLVVNRFDASRLTDDHTDLGLGDDDGIVLIGESATDPMDLDAASAQWFGTGLEATRAIADGSTTGHRLVLLTRGAFGVDSAAARPSDALAVGLAGVIPNEYPEIDTLLIDTAPGDDVDAQPVVDEMLNRHADRIVALRDGRRLVTAVRRTESVADEENAPTFLEGGSYLVTGGLGAIGHSIARHLAGSGCRLAIVSSSDLPPADERSAWLREHGPMDPTSVRLRRLAELETLGAQVQLIVADLAQPHEVVRALDEAQRAFGPLDGAVHAAGTLRDRLIALADADDIEVVIGVKARGALTLTTELERRGADLLVLVSSTSTVLTPAGQVAYVASNAVLDALAGQHGDLRVVTIGYGVWSGVGMAHEAAERLRHGRSWGAPVTNPVFEERVDHGGGSVTVFGHLGTAHHWFLDEHRTADGQAVLPGTGHLELLAAAAVIARGTDDPILSAVTVHEPLAVPDDRIVAVRVDVVDGPNGATIELQSDGGTVAGWVLHSSAMIADTVEMMRPIEFDDSALLPIDPFGEQRERLRLGPRWEPISQASTTGDTTTATIALDPALTDDSDLWRAHPALVDAATGLGAALVRKATDTADLLVPVGYERVSFHGVVPTEVRAVIQMHDAPEGSTPKLDVHLYDPSGRGVLAIDGLQLWPVPADRGLGSSVSRSAGPEVLHIASLVELADGLGIRPDEGVALLEQLLLSGRPRLVGSSIDLDQLRSELAEPEVAPGPLADVPASPVSGTSLIDRIATIWQELLGVGGIHANDNFFDLGGHSLIAIRMMSRIQRDVGVRLQLTDILEAPNLASLATMVEQLMPEPQSSLDVGEQGSTPRSSDIRQPEHRSLVQISSGGSGPPLFIVHGAGGNVLFLWSLARALSGDRSVYGFQAIGVNGTDMPDPTIEAMAARYVAELRASHRGPYLLGGYSGGGTVTLEMVRQLQDLGEEVAHVILFDSVPPGEATPGFVARVSNFSQNVWRSGWGSVQPFCRRKVSTWYRRLRPYDQWRLDHLAAEERALGTVDVEGVNNLFSYFSATADRYALKTYDVDTTVLKADYVWPVQPSDYYWGDFIRGSLTIRTVPGDHHSMFYPENVTQLAEVVRRSLDPWRTVPIGT
jgi:acyl transferase domain-containing protein/thioesterase domain-containing protein/acyl carrier protein